MRKTIVAVIFCAASLCLSSFAAFSDETKAPASAPEAGESYEPQWERGWLVSAHPLKKEADLFDIDPAFFAIYADDDYRTRILDPLNYLPAKFPASNHVVLHTGYIHVEQPTEYVFSPRFALPIGDVPKFSNAKRTCGAKIIIDGVNEVLNDRKIFVNNNSPEVVVGASSVQLEPGYHQFEFMTYCSLNDKDVGKYFEATRVAMFNDVRAGHTEKENRVKELGLEIEMLVSIDGSMVRPLNPGEIFFDANEAHDVARANEPALAFQPSGGLPDGSNGAFRKGAIVELYKLAASRDEEVWGDINFGVRPQAVYETAKDVFNSINTGDTKDATPGRNRLVAKTNLLIEEVGTYTFATSLTHSKFGFESRLKCRSAMKIAFGDKFVTVLDGFAVAYEEGTEFTYGAAKFDEPGVYPINVHLNCETHKQSRKVKRNNGYAGIDMKLFWRKPSDSRLQPLLPGNYFVEADETSKLPRLTPEKRVNTSAPKFSAPPSFDKKPKLQAPRKQSSGRGLDLLFSVPGESSVREISNAEDIAAAFDAGAEVNLRVSFESGSYRLDDAGKREADKLATALKTDESIRIAMRGHTDAEGGEEDNYTLAENRVKMVAIYLIKEHGINKSRFAVLETAGETEPIASNDTAEGRALNRRVVVKKFEG